MKNFFVQIGLWFKSLFVAVEPATESKLKTLWKKDGTKTLVASIICALLGIIIGYIVLLVINAEHATENIFRLLKNFMQYKKPDTKLYYFGSTLVKAAPLIMCGLSVMFAYKTGLFNIGSAGQYTVGICACLYSALAWELPWFLCLLIAVMASAVWGALSGALKAYFNVNEVIACIMTNWIGLYITNIVLSSEIVMNQSLSETYSIANKNAGALLPGMGLPSLFNNNKYVTIALFLTIIIAIALKILIDKTTFGYELKATGSNKLSAKYVGMKEKRNIVLTMAIAGALAGLGASFYYQTGMLNWKTSSSLPAMGFNGIAVAFLGGLDPIGILFAGYFITHITLGGGNLQLEYYNPQIADLIVAVIVYLCGFVLLIRQVIKKIEKRNTEKRLVKASMEDKQC